VVMVGVDDSSLQADSQPSPGYDMRLGCHVVLL